MQEILFYGSETWVLSTSTAKRIDGTHTEFLQIITGKRAKHLGDGTWETTGVEGIQEAAETHLDRIYIYLRKASVAQWVALSPLF